MSYGVEESSNGSRLTLKKKFVKFAYDSGLIRLGRQLFSRSLTVLNYHRIDDPDRKNFDSFIPNVSATPDEFTRQLEYLSKYFNIVSLSDLINWLDGKQKLPPYAAMITFDDGYLDNYTNAFPILQRFNFPAIIFLTTSHIDTDAPFYWDLAAYSFFHTGLDHLKLPDGSETTWSNSEELNNVGRSWIESMKVLPDAEKRTWVSRLPDLLNVSIPPDFFRKLMLNWDQIREMHKNGIEFGAHTMNHPILTQIPLDTARTEIEGSKDRIEKEIGREVLSFAYPNGLSNDINPSLESLVAHIGLRTAFTLFNGPSSLREVRNKPFAIRRVFISHKHSLAQFAALVSPINRYRT